MGIYLCLQCLPTYDTPSNDSVSHRSCVKLISGLGRWWYNAYCGLLVVTKHAVTITQSKYVLNGKTITLEAYNCDYNS